VEVDGGGGAVAAAAALAAAACAYLDASCLYQACMGLKGSPPPLLLLLLLAQLAKLLLP
jgi:hypothetical protein